MAVRVLRVLRIFRVLKLAKYISEAEQLIKALRASRRKIMIFMYTVLTGVVMILGYGMIAVPTGIVTAELTSVSPKVSTQTCIHCSAEGHDHDHDATHCKFCGAKL